MFNSVLLFALGPTEIIVILVIVLLLFGGRKIPELMRGLGTGIKEFKDATKEINDEIKDVKDDTNKSLKG
jgi:sec-independent protein translocase protein TatA